MREQLLARAQEWVLQVIQVGNNGVNSVDDNPEKAQFIAPMGGFTNFRVVANPLDRIGRG